MTVNSFMKSNSRSVKLTVSAMQLPLWRLEVMSQVLRMQLTHMQTRSDTNAHTQRGSYRGREKGCE